MDEYQKRLSCLQKRVAYDVIINNYDFLVGCVDALRIFPCLVSSRLVEPDFRQFLDGERTDKDKMMALLTELTRRPEGTWFDRFTNALSKFPQYHTVADVLLTDFSRVMKEKMVRPLPEDSAGSGFLTDTKLDEPASNHLVETADRVPAGIDEMLKKAMDAAQESMKEAKEDHRSAMRELKKTNARLLEAEKGRFYAEAEKRILEDRAQEVSDKLNSADEKLRQTELHEQLLKKEAQNYKDDAKETQKQLSASRAELHLNDKIAREKLQEVEIQRDGLELRVTSLQAEVESDMRERKEEVASLEQQLCESRKQQQSVEEEMKRLWKEIGEKQQKVQGATRQLDEMKAKHQGELGQLKRQLERNASRTASLEKKLSETTTVKERLERDIEKYGVEQAEAKVIQEQKLTELRKELEVVISERDNLKEEVERLKTEHRHIGMDTEAASKYTQKLRTGTEFEPN